MTRSLLVAAAVALLPALATAAPATKPDKPTSRKTQSPATQPASEDESLVTDLAIIVADLRKQVAELRDEVAQLRRQVGASATPAAPPTAEPDDLDARMEEAVKRGQIVVGMTRKQAARARPQWRGVVRQSGHDYEVVHYGRAYRRDGGADPFVDVAVIATFRNGRIVSTITPPTRGPR